MCLFVVDCVLYDTIHTHLQRDLQGVLLPVKGLQIGNWCVNMRYTIAISSKKTQPGQFYTNKGYILSKVPSITICISITDSFQEAKRIDMYIIFMLYK